MPARVNGIGTTYLGQANAQTERGICESCRNHTALSSYETRLWFTVFFIPVIPLGKRQILNYCPLCTRHRAVPIGEWQEIQSKSIGAAIAGVDADPNSPERAIECHATLAACGKQAEAAQFGETMSVRFRNHADVQMYLGSWLERIGRSEQADACFARALEAAPDNPHALRAVAVGLAEQGRPHEAERMLAGLVPPSKHYDPAVFFQVGKAYQKKADHESALRLFKMVTETTPMAAKEKPFRAAVRESESALGRVGSVLPTQPWYSRRAVWWGALAAALVAALFVADRYFASHRELFVVNGLPQPITVRLDSGEPVSVPAQGQLRLTSGEGPHKISVIEPAALAREEQFTMDDGIIGRWSGSNVEVVDPSRSAVVVWEESIYSRQAGGGGGDFRLHVGEPYLRLEDIDYKFEEFPAQIKSEGHREKIAKHRVRLEAVTPLQLVINAPEALAGQYGLDYLEAHLATTEDRRDLANHYLVAAMKAEQMDRCRDFFKKGLDSQPVDVDWHRAYQTIAEASGRGEELKSEYDALVAKNPDSADLQYLRGRVEPFGADCAPYFEAALKQDPQHNFTLASQSFRRSAAGEFEDALAVIDRAIEVHPARVELRDQRGQILHSLGRHDEVVEEIRRQIAATEGAAWGLHLQLIDALCTQSDAAAAERAAEEFAQIVDRDWPEDPMQLKLKGQMTAMLAARKFAELQSAVAGLKEASQQAGWTFLIGLCEGRTEDAAAALESFPASSRGISYLALSIAERNQPGGDGEPKSLQKAIDAMAAGNQEERIAAKWLEKPPADSSQLVMHLADLSMTPDDKLIVVLALAAAAGENRAELMALAEKLSKWPSARRPFTNMVMETMR